MKMFKYIFTFFFTAALFLMISSFSVSAAENEPYTYKITFYSGNIGSFAGETGLNISNEDAIVHVSEDKITISKLNLGDVVTFNAQANVKLDKTDKHYVQGFRLSGYDNDTVEKSVITVERDRDYTVAYGIEGNMTSYTIKYQTKDGKTLAPNEVYYGNVGDKPVVPYLYIDGYVPQYLALTKTLSSTESENIFIFVYEKFVGPSASDGGTRYTYEEIIINGGTIYLDPVNGGVATIGGGSTNVTGGNAAGGNTAGDAGMDDDGNAQGNVQDSETNEDEEGFGILDLDDEEVPLANVDLEKDGVSEGLQLAGYVALGLTAACLLAFLIMLLKKNRKTEEHE